PFFRQLSQRTFSSSIQCSLHRQRRISLEECPLHPFFRLVAYAFFVAFAPTSHLSSSESPLGAIDTDRFHQPIAEFTPQTSAAYVSLDSFIVATMAQTHIAGLSACIVRDGAIAWSGAFGYSYVDAGIPVTDSTLFMLASVSKT